MPAPPTPPSPRPRRLRARRSASLLALAAALLLALGAGTGWRAELEVASALRAHLAALLLLLVPALALTGARGRAALALAAGIAGAAALGPVWSGRALVHASPEAPVVTLLSANLRRTNPDVVALAQALIAQDADILALQEVPPGFLDSSPALTAAYPHRLVARGESPPSARALLSRLPLAPEGRRGGHRPGYATAVALTPLGPLRVMSLHFGWPFDSVRRPQAEAFGRFAADFAGWNGGPAPLAVALGDFNAPPWSPLLARVEAVTGLRTVAGLRGSFRFLAPGSLPAALAATPFGLPLDHALVSQGLVPLSIEARPLPGSDHMALRLRIAAAP